MLYPYKYLHPRDKKILLGFYESRCQICGYYPKRKERKNRIHIHHLDKNKQNNSPTNLMVVCVSCHGKIHSSKKPKKPTKPKKPVHAKRDYRIWELRKSGFTYSKIGKLFGLTHQRVQQIIKKLSTESP